MLLDATTGTLPASSAGSVPRWPGPDPIIAQVQCIFYATLSAVLLASFLAMLGKQWLNRYRRNEIHGSAVDRSRVRERKLDRIERWRFHLVMESLPLIPRCALLLLGFALSRYLWEVNRSISSVVIGFTVFGFLFYLLITTASIYSFDCPFHTRDSFHNWSGRPILAESSTNLRTEATTSTIHDAGGTTQFTTFDERRRQRTRFRSKHHCPRLHSASCNTVSVVGCSTFRPGDGLDARCISRMFITSTDSDVVTSIMNFILEIIWHDGIKNVPLDRFYGILMDCFDFSGQSPVVVPKLRGVAYPSARAFTHIELQRRCITQSGEYKQDGWKDLCAEHRPLSPTDYGADSDLEAVLFMVDMTLGYGYGFPWEQIQMTPPHHAWVSHMFLYHTRHEGGLSGVLMDFVENSMSLKPPSDIVITDCLFIGLTIGIPFCVSDLIVRDKGRACVFVRMQLAESSHLAVRRTPSSGKSSEFFQ